MTFRRKKTIKNHNFFSIDDTRYRGFDTPYFLILWKGSRSRLSMDTQYDILKAGWQSSTLSWWQNDKDILTEYLPLSLCCLLPDMTSGCCPLSGDSLWSSLPWAWLSLHCCPPCQQFSAYHSSSHMEICERECERTSSSHMPVLICQIYSSLPLPIMKWMVAYMFFPPHLGESRQNLWRQIKATRKEKTFLNQ